MKGDKLVNWERTVQCLLCPQASGLLLPRAGLHPKGCWMSIQLILGTLWQQRQEIHVLVPSAIPFFPQHPLLPPILHPKIWEVERGAEQTDCLAACTGMEQLFFYLPGLEDSSWCPAWSCWAVISSQLGPHCCEFQWKSSFLNLFFPNNAHSLQLRGVWGDFLSPLGADPAYSQAFALVLK